MEGWGEFDELKDGSDPQDERMLESVDSLDEHISSTLPGNMKKAWKKISPEVKQAIYEYFKEYGNVTAICDGGELFGGHVSTTIDLEGVVFQLGLGLGEFGGCAVVVNIETGEAAGLGLTLSTSGGDVGYSFNSSGTISKEGANINGGFGVLGGGFGSSFTITYTTQKLRWKMEEGGTW